MQLREEKEGDILIVKLLEERLDASVAAAFNGQMRGFIDNGNDIIVLDMSAVAFIDSSGLAAVISIVKKLGDKGELVLFGMRAPILSLFQMTRLDRLVKTFSKKQEAISELSGSHEGKDNMYKRIKLMINSDLENVSLVGIVINKLCSLIPLSDTDSYQIELCVVEAVNNSIEHAYGMESGHEVEVLFTLHSDRLVVDVCDTGNSMDQECLEQKDGSLLDVDPPDLDSIAEKGRGIPIMKQIMDTVTYKTEGGKNCLTLVKNM